MANPFQRFLAWRNRQKSIGDTKQIDVHTAEGLVLKLTLAAPFQRAVVVVLDQLLVLLVLILFIIGYFYSGINTLFNSALATILFYLTTFFLRTFALMVQEMVWNGRTLCKMWFGMRVISLDGTGLKSGQVLVRNLVREMEFFLPVMVLFGGFTNFGFDQYMAVAILLVTVCTIFFSRRSQRMGDYLANTVVVMDPKPVLLADMAAPSHGDLRFTFTKAQLDHYGRHELHVLEDVLRVKPAKGKKERQRQEEKQLTIAQTIARRIGWNGRIVGGQVRPFLAAFYAAQRDHLERRRMMGDMRENKFHTEPSPDEKASP
ncbi:MAG: RDD family protein [Pseudomonadota bacterium]